MLQIGAALFYYKLGQTLLQIGAASLLQIGASFVTNWGSYYKSEQPLLQNRAAITNWGKTYYKLGQVLQIRAIITNWGITYVFVMCYNQHSINLFLAQCDSQPGCSKCTIFTVNLSYLQVLAMYKKV